MGKHTGYRKGLIQHKGQVHRPEKGLIPSEADLGPTVFELGHSIPSLSGTCATQEGGEIHHQGQGGTSLGKLLRLCTSAQLSNRVPKKERPAQVLGDKGLLGLPTSTAGLVFN